jgi:hypothetical protein
MRACSRAALWVENSVDNLERQTAVSSDESSAVWKADGTDDSTAAVTVDWTAH